MACQFENTLHYCSPANGGRGIVRTGMLIPESVELFVCPFACGRHGAISAVKQNLKHRLAYLYVDQSDIINGYDDLIVQAVEDLLAELPKAPKVILVFVSCLDDLIGTDHEALQELLSEKYPHIKFRSCHMNPITTGSTTPPPISIQNNMYSLLDVAEEKDNGVNCLGGPIAINKDTEIYAILESLGFKELRHISNYDTFAGYQDMARSQFNLVIAPPARQAAGQMEEKHGTPFAFLPVSYRMDEIKEQYHTLMTALGKATDDFDLGPYEQATREAINRALAAVGDAPIVVDRSAAVRPFGMARALLEYGFNVVRVQAQECIGSDKGNYEWLCANHPEVEIVQPQHHKAVLREDGMPDSIAMGVDGAYHTGSRYVVDVFADEGMYGYKGLEIVMNKLEHALDKEVNLEEMVHEYGLVV